MDIKLNLHQKLNENYTNRNHEKGIWRKLIRTKITKTIFHCHNLKFFNGGLRFLLKLSLEVAV